MAYMLLAFHFLTNLSNSFFVQDKVEFGSLLNSGSLYMNINPGGPGGARANASVGEVKPARSPNSTSVWGKLI